MKHVIIWTLLITASLAVSLTVLIWADRHPGTDRGVVFLGLLPWILMLIVGPMFYLENPTGWPSSPPERLPQRINHCPECGSPLNKRGLREGDIARMADSYPFGL